MRRPNRLVRRRSGGVGERADRYSNQVGQPLWLPVHIRPTAWAEVKLDRKPARRWALEDNRLPLHDAHAPSFIERSNAERAPRPPLAIQAMAHRNFAGRAIALQLQSPAMAAGLTSLHGSGPLVEPQHTTSGSVGAGPGGCVPRTNWCSWPLAGIGQRPLHVENHQRLGRSKKNGRPGVSPVNALGSPKSAIGQAFKVCPPSQRQAEHPGRFVSSKR